MLLWPHPLIPDDGFIDPRHDQAVLAAAQASLDGFGFAGCLEDPALVGSLGLWLGTAIHPQIVNETAAIPPALQGKLASELDPASLARLSHLSRLDLKLWEGLAIRFVAAHELAAFREGVRLRNVARFATMLAGAA